MILFNQENINILKTCKAKIKKLGKNVDESEVWMKNLGEPKNVNVLKETQNLFEFFNDILFVGCHLDDKNNVINDS